MKEVQKRAARRSVIFEAVDIVPVWGAERELARVYVPAGTPRQYFYHTLSSAHFLQRTFYSITLPQPKPAAVQYRLKPREPQPNPGHSKRSRQIAVSFRFVKNRCFCWQFVSPQGAKTDLSGSVPIGTMVALLRGYAPPGKDWLRVSLGADSSP